MVKIPAKVTHRIIAGQGVFLGQKVVTRGVNEDE